MIDVEGFTFIGNVKLAWPIAGKIAELSKPAIAKKMLCGVTCPHTEYKKIPDPEAADISHFIISVRPIAIDTIEVVGQFLVNIKGEEVLTKFKANPNLAKNAKIFPNMYAIPGKDANGNPTIEKETVCTIDILLEE